MISDPLQLGFRVHYFRDLANAGTVDLRTVKMDESVPLEVQNNCPACKNTLRVFCTLIAGHGKNRIRIGCCKACGYMGYIDRPSQDWIVRYYKDEWDNAQMRDIKEEAKKLKHGLSPEQYDMVHATSHLPVSREKAVCDIGCGNGAILKEFENIGFRNLIGVENSRYRAELAREKYGYPVLIGNFENPEIRRELESKLPIGIFTSFHVMEHVYDPEEVLRVSSSLQQENDYLIFAMPDVLFEPSIITLFWLPHLHSYTRVSLERLFNSFGYEVIQDNFTYKRLMMTCQKKVNPRPRYAPENDYINSAAERLRKWFFLDNMNVGKKYRVSWTSKSYHTNYKQVFSSRFLDKIVQGMEQAYDFSATRFMKMFTNRRSLVISPLEKRFTSFEESPFEIQFDGDIELLVR